MTERDKVNLANEYFESLARDQELAARVLVHLMEVISAEVKTPSPETVVKMVLISHQLTTLAKSAANRIEIRKKLGEQPTPKGATIN